MDAFNSNLSDEKKTICIEKQYDYYVDIAGLLKGEFDKCIELKEKGPDGETMYELEYYKVFENHTLPFTLPYMQCLSTVVNENGYFYNKFSCKKYDMVEDIGSGYYRCEKNDRYGILNEEGQEIIHTCYSEVRKISRQPVFLVRCETGLFIYNLKLQKQSKVYEEIEVLDSNYIRFYDGVGYGLMNYNCDIVIPPKFERPISLGFGYEEKYQLWADFKGQKFGVNIEGDLFFGKVSPAKYDQCFKVNHFHLIELSTIYITKKDSKYGILNYRFDSISEPQLDDILLVPRRSSCRYVTLPSSYFVIGKQNDYYKLFNSKELICIIDNCSSMDYCLATDNGIDRNNFNREFKYNCIEFCKDGHCGYVTYNGKIIGFKEYDSVDLFRYSFLVSKNNRYGLLSESGDIIIPCEYDEIRYDNMGSFVLVKDGKETKEKIRNLLSLPKSEGTYSDYEPQHYSQYSGSYAQDEMEYSDEDIDTVFDGDPSAYWNID